jgi:hypothetical protein
MERKFIVNSSLDKKVGGEAATLQHRDDTRDTCFLPISMQVLCLRTNIAYKLKSRDLSPASAQKPGKLRQHVAFNFCMHFSNALLIATDR